MSAFLSWVPSFLFSLLAFIGILVPLVVFHEFGHFIFAKIFGVKAETFSVGFGPRLWGRKFGETEFRLSAIPLGGYVKLLGEDRDAEIPPEDLKRALHKQVPWKRFLIFFGGPLFNFILAVFIFMAVLAIGEPQTANVIGRVVRGSEAEKDGFRSGDRVLSIDGKPIKKYEEILEILNENPGKTLAFSVKHPGAAQAEEIQAKTSAQTGFNMYGEETHVGEIDGLLPIARSTQVGVSNPASPASQEGIETGDKIVSFNGKPVTTWEEIEQSFDQLPPQSQFEVAYQKAEGSKETKKVTWVRPSDQLSFGNAFGLHSSELFIEKVVAHSPAEKGGVQKGDRLLGVGIHNVHSFFELKNAVQKGGEADGKVFLRWERKGRLYSAEIIPTAASGRSPVLKKTTQYTVGVIPMLTLVEPETFVEREWNPIKLVVMATDRMVTLTWRNLISLKKMVTGDVSLGSLGGPIMIGKIAGESLSRGLITFLMNMGLFSISLGLLNILPIPVLDGGHLMLLSVEIVRGKPLTLKQMEIVQGVGLVFILLLMGIAFHNDISRLFS